MKYLESGDNGIDVLNASTYYLGYNLYGLERVGLASGFKYFGKHDWYRELAAKAVPTQWPNGAFGRGPEGADAITDSAFAILFLSRGRHPIFMNKLRFEKFWTNRPRDIANLARFASRELERPLNWQVVTLERDWNDWLDSPILYIASHEKLPTAWGQDIDKLKASEFREEVLYKLVNGRTTAGRPLAISSNCTPGELERWVGKAGRSRLMTPTSTRRPRCRRVLKKKRRV